MQLTRLLLPIVTFALVGCSGLTAPTPTPTLTPTASLTPTLTFTPSLTPTATVTLTPSPSPTVTPTPTASLTPTLTPTPSNTPEPVAQFLNDNSALLDIPDDIRDGIDTPYVAFLNTNDRETIGNLSTASPQTNLVTLYYAPATNPAARVPIIEVRSEDASNFYVSQNGMAVAYLQDDPLGLTSGLYVIDVSIGLNVRAIPMTSLVQRGRASVPQWSPDGRTLAIALATGCDIDIFTLDLASFTWRNLTQSGAYDWNPVWSPDGTRIAFLSDRANCPSWIPGDSNACDANFDMPPTAGNVYVMDVRSGEVTRVIDLAVSEPPVWVTNTRLSLAVTNPADPLSPERALWLADLSTGNVRQMRASTADTPPIYSGEAWSADGTKLIVLDSSGGANRVVLMRDDGTVIASDDRLTFPRFGMVAAWSPDGSRIALGGIVGQCPYGRVVIDAALTESSGSFAYTAAPGVPQPNSMCSPTFSANSAFAAFMGVTGSATGAADGRADVYVVNNNGFGQGNLTANLRGNVRLLGWVGGG